MCSGIEREVENCISNCHKRILFNYRFFRSFFAIAAYSGDVCVCLMSTCFQVESNSMHADKA